MESNREKLLKQIVAKLNLLDRHDGVKMQQILLLWIFLPLVIYQSGFDLFNMAYFSKIPLLASLDILCSGP